MELYSMTHRLGDKRIQDGSTVTCPEYRLSQPPVWQSAPVLSFTEFEMKCHPSIFRFVSRTLFYKTFPKTSLTKTNVEMSLKTKD
jgi:hypothetical protein